MKDPTGHILVVDDDREIRELLRDYLEQNHYLFAPRVAVIEQPGQVGQ